MKIGDAKMKKLIHLIGWMAILLAIVSFIITLISDKPWLYRQPFTDAAFGYSLSFIASACVSVIVSYCYPRSLRELYSTAKSQRLVPDLIVLLIGIAVAVCYIALGLIGPLMFKNSTPAMAAGLMLGSILWGEATSRMVTARLSDAQETNQEPPNKDVLIEQETNQEPPYKSVLIETAKRTKKKRDASQRRSTKR